MDRVPEAGLGPSTPHRSFFGVLLFGTAATALFVSCWMWPGGEGWWGPGTSAIFAYALFALHLAISVRYLNGFDPLIWAPVLTLLYYFGLPVAVNLSSAYNTYDTWNLRHGADPPQLTLSFAVALLTLVSMIFGFHLGGYRNLNTRPIPARPADRNMFWPAMCLAYGGLAMTTFGTLAAGPSVILGTYSEMTFQKNIGRFDPRFIFSGFIFSMAGAYALWACYDGKRRLHLALAGLATFMVVFYLFLLGDRGGMSGFIFAAGFGFAVRVRRLSKWVVLLAFTGALMLMPVMKEYREFKMAEVATRVSPLNLVLAVFVEMGSTFQVFCYTLENIPSQKGYDWGMSYVDAALKAIPNVTLTPGKSFMLDPLKHTPSKWVTFTANPIAYIRTGGRYGNAMGAEWYFNYGLVGVYLGMIATGYAMARFRNAAPRSGMRLMWCSLFISMLLLAIRNSLGALLKAALWPIIGVWILRFVFSKILGSTPAWRTSVAAPDHGGGGYAATTGLSAEEDAIRAEKPSWQQL